MDALFSKSIKTKSRTYFIDVREAKNKAKYLTIAENRRDKDDEKKFIRSSVMVFGDQAQEFRQAFEEAVGVLTKH
ncbi:MAG: DUF3276 family protein [Ignavibacteriae bacterium]|nr:DUF3276 family protein [Ignavibacteriota bacterium]